MHSSFIALLLITAMLRSTISASSDWSVSLLLPDGSRRIVHVPGFVELDDESSENFSCQNCFRLQTIDSGRRMLAESCSNETCVALINSTTRREVLPTIDYNFSECGQTRTSTPSTILKSIQLKVSTSIKNVLRPAEYPWMVRIESRTNDFARTMTLCGGTLIHPQWILTAAHCLIDAKLNKFYPTNGVNIFLGHYNRLLRNHNQYQTTPAFYIIHPKFRITRRSPAPIHDLALIRLARPAPRSRWINPVCLPEPNDELKEGTEAFTAGWGHASPRSTAVDEPRKAKLKVAPRSCRQLMIDPKYHICGRSDRGNNICSGDSGSGLFVRAGVRNSKNETKWKWHVFGVASFGLEECSEKVNHDNAFASVSNDIDWVQEMMKKF